MRRAATGKIDGFLKPSSSLVATAAFGLPAYVNIDRGEGMRYPRRIQVDALRRMVTAVRTSCTPALSPNKETAVDLMDNAVALPTTPQRHQPKPIRALFCKKRPHVAVGPMRGGYHSSANMIVRTRVFAGCPSDPLTSESWQFSP